MKRLAGDEVERDWIEKRWHFLWILLKVSSVMLGQSWALNSQLYKTLSDKFVSVHRCTDFVICLSSQAHISTVGVCRCDVCVPWLLHTAVKWVHQSHLYKTSFIQWLIHSECKHLYKRVCCTKDSSETLDCVSLGLSCWSFECFCTHASLNQAINNEKP